MATNKSLKELKDVANTFSKLAQLYITNGPWKPAYKTGNLYRRVGSYNTADRMITQRPARSSRKFKLPQKEVVTIALNFGPPGAEYGVYVEKGNGTGVGAGRPRGFAEMASKDPLLKKTIDAYVGKFVETDFLPIIDIGLKKGLRELQKNRK